MAKTGFALLELTFNMGRDTNGRSLDRGVRVAMKHREALMMVASGFAALRALDWEGYEDGMNHFPSFFTTNKLTGNDERLLVHVVA